MEGLVSGGEGGNGQTRPRAGGARKNGMSVSILGCGWFGLPLARRLVADGHKVMGSSTSPEKLPLIEKAGALPFVVRIEPDAPAGPEEFFRSRAVVVNFPPGRKDGVAERLAGQAKTLKDALEKGGAEFVVFVSSTSVYADLGRVVTEDDFLEGAPSKKSGTALREMERTLAGGNFDLTVLRFGGLIGYDRNPRVFLKKRQAASRFDLPVNLIHRDDCVEVTARIIRDNIRGGAFNVVCDSHPLRSEFYAKEAEIAGTDIPVFEKPPEGAGKIVSGERLKKALNYRYQREPL